MSTEHSENDLPTPIPVLRNDIPMESMQASVADWSCAVLRNASSPCPDYHAEFYYADSNTFAEEDSRDASFDSNETVVVTDARVTFVDGPQDPTAANEVSDPPVYGEIMNALERQTSFGEECSRIYKEFVKKIRNSKYYKIWFYTLFLVVSISALCLGVRYYNECFFNHELVSLVLLMGMVGVISTIFHVASLAIARLGVDYEKVFEIPAAIFLLLFILMAIAEMAFFGIFMKHVFCRTFADYMEYVNLGIFIMGLVTFFFYIDVILNAFIPSNPNSLCIWMRLLCRC